jgi:hypothetical protein
MTVVTITQTPVPNPKLRSTLGCDIGLSNDAPMAVPKR